MFHPKARHCKRIEFECSFSHFLFFYFLCLATSLPRLLGSTGSSLALSLLRGLLFALLALAEIPCEEGLELLIGDFLLSLEQLGLVPDRRDAD